MAGCGRFWSTLAFFILIGLLYPAANAVAVDPEQREILYRIRDELPSLESVPTLPWTNASIDAVCQTFQLYGVKSCNSTGWVSQIRFDSAYSLGAMPPSLGDMAGLTSLYAYYTFTGSLVPEWGNLSNLRSFELYYNPHLAGPVPVEWKALKSLQSFKWYGSDGPYFNIPEWMGEEWPELNILRWARLGATGPFPAWLSALSMISIDLSENSFEGAIPSSVTSLSTLKSLLLGQNKFNGSVPSDWSDATSLEDLDLSNNLFTGSLPAIPPPMLVNLYAYQNSFSGSIPQSWMDLPNLGLLSIEQNLFSGELPWPTTPANSALSQVYIGRNPGLGGSIPAGLWRVPQLFSLYFSETAIHGPFPDDIGPDCVMTDFGAPNTVLNCPLPSRLDLCADLYYVDFSNASLTGPFPPALANSTRMNSLYLADNDLSGPLFEDWSKLTSLIELHLSRNQLSGPISESLLNLTLNSLFLNDNHFDLCGDTRLNNDSIRYSLSCNVSNQQPRECGCPGVWTQCLDEEMIPVCPPPSPISEPTTPTGASSSSKALPSWFPTQSHPMTAFIACGCLLLLFVSS